MSNDPKGQQHFIQDAKFQLLKACQQEIFLATEISPSLRKIVNELINQENLHTVKTKFMEIWRENSNQ